MSIGSLTNDATHCEWGFRDPPVVHFFIGPTNLKGRHPAIARSTMTPVILFKSTFNELNQTLGRFFGKHLPVMVIGKACRVTDDDGFISKMSNTAFLHREAGGYHILAKIYLDDVTGKEARKRLHTTAEELENISSSESTPSSRSQLASPQQLKTKPLESTKLKFGHTYADYMMTCDWDAQSGWHHPKIEPIGELRIHPGAKVLHYASELFEGMKAYRGVDNQIRMFRPEMDVFRMKRTAIRAALPDFDSEELVSVLANMLRMEWVSHSDWSSLFMRPTLIGTDPTLGVGCATRVKMVVHATPIGACSTQFQSLNVLCDRNLKRVFRGDTHWVGKEAASKNCQQVLWIIGWGEFLTEIGSLSIFIFWKNEDGDMELITPPLFRGLILPGVTRDSILEIGREWGYKVTERTLNMQEVKKALAEKRLYEMFGSGTACVVSPVGKILYHNKITDEYEELHIPTMASKYGVMQKFYNTINDIQYGRLIKEGWTRDI